MTDIDTSHAAVERLLDGVTQARELSASMLEQDAPICAEDAYRIEVDARDVAALLARAEAAEAALAAERETVARLTEALRFYANEENYKGQTLTDPCGCCSSWYEPKIHIDGEDSGGIARAALTQKEQPDDE